MQQQAELFPEVRYHIPFAMFKEAYKAFQKRYVYPKSYGIMALLAIVAVIYGVQVVHGTPSQQPMYCMVIMFCVVLAIFQWYSPRKTRRNLMEAVREIEEDQYFLRVYADCLEIGTMLPEEEVRAETKEADALFEDTPQENYTGSRIHYSDALLVTEYDTFFMLYLKKSMIYVIPKDAFDTEQLQLLKSHFAKVLGKNYKTSPTAVVKS